MLPAVRGDARGEKPAAPGEVCGIKERGREKRRRGQGAGEQPPLVVSAGCCKKTWAIEKCVSFQ